MQSSLDYPSAALKDVIASHEPFAMVKKQGQGTVSIFRGELSHIDTLKDIPRRSDAPSSQRVVDAVCAIPYSQIQERGYEALRDADECVLNLSVREEVCMAVRELCDEVFAQEINFETGMEFDSDDEEYASIVEHIIKDEIGGGEGANFVIPRTAEGRIAAFTRAHAVRIFQSLLAGEFGSYMHFLMSDGERYLIGASPERHLTVERGIVTMNPISGTLRKTREGLSKVDLLRFLRDPKEIMELFMVLDEELKMMSQMCEEGGEIRGPLLKEMSKLLHTEYELVGRSRADMIDLFRHSMYAPTVTGSPVQNACRINRKYDHNSRRYYSGALALLGRDGEGGEFLDSAIMIRTMEIDRSGLLRMKAGSTIVRDSNPLEEAKEARAKLSALAASLGVCSDPASQPILPHIVDREVEMVLQERNSQLSSFFFEDQAGKDTEVAEIKGKRITIVDGEDDFSSTLAHMIRRMGAQVEVVSSSTFVPNRDRSDLVLIGPGPGDPNDMNDPKMRKFASILIDLEHGNTPFLAVCLGHQILSKVLGMDIVRKTDPSQGVRKEIDLFGEKQQVGFYNTFVAQYRSLPGVRASYDSETSDVHALRGPRYASFQFHPESVLTQNGYEILSRAIQEVLSGFRSHMQDV